MQYNLFEWSIFSFCEIDFFFIVVAAMLLCGSTLIRLRICLFTQLKWLKKQLKFTGSRNKKQLKSLIGNRMIGNRRKSLLGSR